MAERGAASAAEVMRAYRQARDAQRRPVLSRYRVIGFLNSGTYGRVYKAQEILPPGAFAREPGVYAIKKFKPDREGSTTTFTGISQSAVREIALNRELRHENVVWLREVMLEENAIFLVYEFVEHDFLQIIHHHLTVLRTPVSGAVIKSLLWQVLNGVQYLHENWIMHRDLKPANILITARGVVKIGDLGLARVYADPMVSLYASDMVVVTIWYRAPELLLGARHYTPAVDLWAVGCIWGELIALRPMFKGEEIRMGPKVKTVPLQTYVPRLRQEPAREDCRHPRHADQGAVADDGLPARLWRVERAAPWRRVCTSADAASHAHSTSGTQTVRAPRRALTCSIGCCSTILRGASRPPRRSATPGSRRNRCRRQSRSLTNPAHSPLCRTARRPTPPARSSSATRTRLFRARGAHLAEEISVGLFVGRRCGSVTNRVRSCADRRDWRGPRVRRYLFPVCGRAALL